MLHIRLFLDKLRYMLVKYPSEESEKSGRVLTKGPHSHESDLPPDSAGGLNDSQDTDEEEGYCERSGSPQRCSTSTKPLDEEPTTHVTDYHESRHANGGIK